MNVPVDFIAGEFKLDNPDMDLVDEVFEELEFRRLKDSFKKVFESEKNNLEKKIVEVKSEINKGNQLDLFSTPGV